ncbi:MAG: hypothetical protein WCS37_10390 [Chloroflexota bacterium]
MTTTETIEIASTANTLQLFTPGTEVLWLEAHLGTSQGCKAKVLRQTGQGVLIQLALAGGWAEPVAVKADTLRLLCNHCKIYPVYGNGNGTWCERCTPLTLDDEPLPLLDMGLDLKHDDVCPVCECPMRRIYATKDGKERELHCAECDLEENYFQTVQGFRLTAQALLTQLERAVGMIEEKNKVLPLNPADWKREDMARFYEAIRMGRGVFGTDQDIEEEIEL